MRNFRNKLNIYATCRKFRHRQRKNITVLNWYLLEKILWYSSCGAIFFRRPWISSRWEWTSLHWGLKTSAKTWIVVWIIMTFVSRTQPECIIQWITLRVWSGRNDAGCAFGEVLRWNEEGSWRLRKELYGVEANMRKESISWTIDLFIDEKRLKHQE